MEGGTFWRLVLVAVVAYFAVRLVLWLLHAVLGLLQIGIFIAVIVGIVWVLLQIFGRKRMVY